jgi:hypothetical protein
MDAVKEGLADVVDQTAIVQIAGLEDHRTHFIVARQRQTAGILAAAAGNEKDRVNVRQDAILGERAVLMRYKERARPAARQMQVARGTETVLSADMADPLFECRRPEKVGERQVRRYWRTRRDARPPRKRIKRATSFVPARQTSHENAVYPAAIANEMRRAVCLNDETGILKGSQRGLVRRITTGRELRQTEGAKAIAADSTYRRGTDSTSSLRSQSNHDADIAAFMMRVDLQLDIADMRIVRVQPDGEQVLMGRALASLDEDAQASRRPVGKARLEIAEHLRILHPVVIGAITDIDRRRLKPDRAFDKSRLRGHWPTR